MPKPGYRSLTFKVNIVNTLEKLKIKTYDSLCDVVERLLKEKRGKLEFDMIEPVSVYSASTVRTMVYPVDYVVPSDVTKLSYSELDISVIYPCYR